jgi:hypothetical protein
MKTVEEVNQQQDDECWWGIGGSNIETIYGWGSEDEASQICDRSKKAYTYWPLSQKEYEEQKCYLEDGDLGFNMSDELIAIMGEEAD